MSGEWDASFSLTSSLFLQEAVGPGSRRGQGILGSVPPVGLLGGHWGWHMGGGETPDEETDGGTWRCE